MRPKVSVLIITYNHAPFIGEALDSALSQRTDFDYEIVVTDDSSTDGTTEIVAEYARAHPDVIRATLNEVNVGPHVNFRQTLQRTTGEYVALLDGDDYWTSPTKLQRQADYLDANPTCTLVFHPSLVQRPDGRSRVWYPPGRRASYDLRDLLRGNFIGTGSVMCRHAREVELPGWYDISRMMPGDWIYYSLIARRGYIGCLPTPMSVYRLQAGGVWAGGTPDQRIQRLRDSIDVCRRLNADFDNAYPWSVRYAVAVFTLKVMLHRWLPTFVDPLTSARDRLVGAVYRLRGAP